MKSTTIFFSYSYISNTNFELRRLSYGKLTEHVCVFASLLPGCFSSFPFFFGQEAVKLR